MSESIFNRQSLFIRFLLKNLTDVNNINKLKVDLKLTDKQIIDLTIPYSDLPQLFTNDNNDLETNLNDIINMNLEFKKLSLILNGEYKTTYPYNVDLALKEFKNLSNYQGSIVIHEAFFLQYSGLVSLYLKTLNVILEQEGTLPLDWRYYIALMV